MMLNKMRRRAFWIIASGAIISAMLIAFLYVNRVHAVCSYDEENELRIYYFLKDELGFNDAAIAGIMGNIYCESKFDINALNPNDTGGTFSYGICQWNSRGRYWNMLNWSIGNGAETGILEVNGQEYQTIDIYYQLCYMAFELRTAKYYRYEELLAVENTVEGAAEAALLWAKFYEGCSSASHEYRKNQAVEVYWPKYGEVSLGIPSVEEIYEHIIFDDVDESDWFYECVNYVADRGVMTGISETEFAPGIKLSRAMTVMLLYKLEGYPAVEPAAEYDESGELIISENSEIVFSDVADGKWYSDAVKWAAMNNIVEGSINKDGTRVFKPNDEIRRQDFMKILYSYAVYKGIDVSVESSDAYTAVEDAKSVSNYAIEYVNWGYSVGFVGVGSKLKPKESISRAETATIIMRFMEKYKENL